MTRCQSVPATPVARAESVPPADAAASSSSSAIEEFVAARVRAEWVARDNAGIKCTIQKILEQTRAHGAFSHSEQEKFVDEYTKLTDLMHSLQPKSASSAHTSAMLALDLLISLDQSKPQTVSAPPQRLIVASWVPKGISYAADMEAFSHAACARSASVNRAPSVTFSGDALRARSVSKEPPRRSRKYNVINPRTGEKMTIKCKVPFCPPKNRRLRILDPRTGHEVLPDATGKQESSASRASPRSNSCNPRMSVDSSSSTRRRSVTPATGRRPRASLAGRCVPDGRSWALEPASGGHWDWPLSRQEKKDRVLMLGQLELLEQIEELKAAGGGHDDLEESILEDSVCMP